MKRMIFSCVAALALTACVNNDDFAVQISEKTQTSFQDMYPGARGVDWEKRGVYKVAIFSYNGDKLTAWYNQDGNWCMTELQMTIASAPSTVVNAYYASSDDANNANYVDKLKRDGIEDIYVVSEGYGNSRIEYYYSTEGVLVKKLTGETLIYEDYRNEIVPQVATSVYSSTGKLYPGSRIMEVDVIFPGDLFVTVIHESMLKTLKFTLTGSWSMSTWEVTENYVKSHCPEAYRTFSDGSYAGCKIKSIDYFESASISYYWFVLDNAGTRVDVGITPEGNIISIN